MLAGATTKKLGSFGFCPILTVYGYQLQPGILSGMVTNFSSAGSLAPKVMPFVTFCGSKNLNLSFHINDHSN